jgi:hypothetical protein
MYGMARLLVTAMFTTALLLPVAADAHGRGPRHSSSTTHAQASAQQMALAKLGIHGPVVLATAVAERYWGAVPCGGRIAVLDDRRLVSGLDTTTDAWVTFNSSLGANNLEAPASTYTRCAISLAHWQWPTRTAMAKDWNMFCLTVIHEMGHLLGHPHSLAPGSVMAAVFTNESNVPAICRATRLLGEGVASRGLAHR